jgi:hypothetical protein
LPDVEIAHTGYYVESRRRTKFSRNLPLLMADRAKYPERVLGKFLYMRDLIHMATQILETNGNRIDQRVSQFCREAIQIYQNSFIGCGGHMQQDGLEYYNAAARILKLGQEYTWLISIDGRQIQKRSQFLTLDDWLTFTKQEMCEAGAITTG